MTSCTYDVGYIGHYGEFLIQFWPIWQINYFRMSMLRIETSRAFVFLDPRGTSFPCLHSHHQPFICQLTACVFRSWMNGDRDFHFRLHMEQPICLKTYSLRLIRLLSLSSVHRYRPSSTHCCILGCIIGNLVFDISSWSSILNFVTLDLRSSNNLPTSILLLLL